MAELIAIGNTAVDSSPFTVAEGAPKTLYIKSTNNGPCHDVLFMLQKQQSNGTTYQDVLGLDRSNINEKGKIVGAGTFRVQRRASTINSAGMDIEG